MTKPINHTKMRLANFHTKQLDQTPKQLFLPFSCGYSALALTGSSLKWRNTKLKTKMPNIMLKGRGVVGSGREDEALILEERNSLDLNFFLRSPVIKLFPG